MRLNIKSIGIIILLLCLNSNGLISQNILKIDDENISTDEFVTMFEKNNAIDTITVSDYLNLFINFKLKVKEAERLGLDQKPEFIKEFNGYKAQLASPYLMDHDFKEKLIREEYEHMKYDIRASHILINLDENALPEDTLKAYNKIMDIRNKALAGESFGALAYKYSDDPSARERNSHGNIIPPNYGDLGYFTAFVMIYEFEKAAYATPVGQISLPVRSKFGYHIIKVTDKVDAMGLTQASHILMFVHNDKTKADSLDALQKTQRAYERLVNGEDFHEIAKQMSEDSSSAHTGGKMRGFLPSQIDPTFMSNLVRLKVGEYSEPFFTPYGCHIAKLEMKQGIKSFDEERTNIINKINQSDRVRVESKKLIETLKNKFNFKYADQSNYNELYPLIVKHFHNTDSIVLSTDKPLFYYDNETVKQSDFIEYIKYLRKSPKFIADELIIYNYYNQFIESKLKEVEFANMEETNQEYRNIVKEYRDGILLYDINNLEVWDKASQDSIGLINYYNKNKYRYPWGDRVDATIIKIEDSFYTKSINKECSKTMDFNEVAKLINEKAGKNIMSVKRDTIIVKDNPILKLSGIKEGLSKTVKYEDNDYIVYIHKYINSTPKDFEDCKGLVLSDYQKDLEIQWIKELKNKYSIVVNREELKKLEEKYDQ